MSPSTCTRVRRRSGSYEYDELSIGYVASSGEIAPGWEEQLGQYLGCELSRGHAFVSYGSDDREYVERLVEHLRTSDVASWIDKAGIDYGDRWEKEIVSNIDSCSVFVVVMTPASEHSSWVMREIARAEKKSKPILPLLLEGDEFFRLSDLQYEPVVGGVMPSTQWVERVKSLVSAV